MGNPNIMLRIVCDPQIFQMYIFGNISINLSNMGILTKFEDHRLFLTKYSDSLYMKMGDRKKNCVASIASFYRKLLSPKLITIYGHTPYYIHIWAYKNQ